MKYESYWLDTAPTLQGGRSELVQDSYDVVVVGGGFTGLSTALGLARQGASVALLEAGRVVGEASGRNGGQCNTGVAQDYAALRQTIGRERAIRYYRAFADAVSTVERLIREESLDCSYLPHGKLKLAAKPEHYEKLARTHDAIREDVDQDIQLFSAQELKSEIDSSAFHGGLLQRHGGQMHVARYGIGLAHSAIKHGAHVYEHTPMISIDAEGRGYRINTAKGSLKAENVLLATGTSQVGQLGWLRRRIVPVGSFIVVTEPLSEEVKRTLLPTQRAYVTSRIIGNYFRYTPDGRLLFGGRARFAMSGGNSDKKSGEILRQGLQQTFPQLQGIRLDYCWGGQVDMSQDRLPHAGRHKGLYYSMGYSGHGVQMSSHMGQVMADIILGKRSDIPWSDEPWQAIFGHFGKPWFLPLVGKWYEFQDRRH